MKLLIAAVLAAGVVGEHDLECSDKPMYSVTMDSDWTQSDHPTLLLPTAERGYGPMVGLTHNYDFTGFNVGMMASQGLAEVAADGFSSGAILDEMEDAGDLVGPYPMPMGASKSASQTLYFNIKDKRSIASFIMGVDPSPDWFLVAGAELCDRTTGEWINMIKGSPRVYDAGVLSQRGFEDADTPQAVQMPISDKSSVTNLATFTFKKLTEDEEDAAKDLMKDTEKQAKEDEKFYKNLMKDMKKICKEDAKEAFKAAEDAAYAAQDVAKEAADGDKDLKKAAKDMRKDAIKAAEDVQDIACDMYD